jgi:phosphopantothenoylcysteine decarboxylase/phosphopantothenate--cysteine ligase
MSLQGKTIVLGVTGGVAAYKAAELTRLLVQQGVAVHVVMTEAATQFVTPVTFQALSGNPVFSNQWDARPAVGHNNNMAHINLTREADAVLIAPASADVMAKLAHGLADDLLTTLCLARTCPLLVAPAMNKQMWEHPATQRNAAQLRADGVAVLGPASGEQACGEIGAGRMLEPAEIMAELTAFFTPKYLAGKRVVITAGPTFEPIDPVRGITNLSSGKMGYALAQAAQQAGADVVLVSGPTALAAPYGVELVDVQTAQQMLAAVQAHIANTDVFIAVAAVADWRVAEPSAQKIKKQAGSLPNLAFVENPDILATIAALPNAPYCVGFAAESENLAEYAQAKRAKKNIPLIVGNVAQTALGADDNELLLCDAAGTQRLPRASKQALAQQLIEAISKRIANI